MTTHPQIICILNLSAILDRHQITIKTILGKYDDPLFPGVSLDMAFSSLTYHEIGNPVVFLKILYPLKMKQ